jgi:hypothetical protein
MIGSGTMLLLRVAEPLGVEEVDSMIRLTSSGRFSAQEEEAVEEFSNSFLLALREAGGVEKTVTAGLTCDTIWR